MKKIILDTDIGCDIDDSLCLQYLINNPDAKLLGITIVSGDVELRAELASSFAPNIPIYLGASRPLVINKEAEFPQQSQRLIEWKHKTEFESVHAVEYLRKTIIENPNEITIIAIGPLTNIALLFAAYPETAPLIKGLYIMGGKFFDGEQLEWNIKFDPHAARIVYNAPVKTSYTTGLDVTLQLYITKENTPFTGKLGQLAEDWYNDISDKIYFHDPLATAIAFEPDICQYEKGNVSMNMETYCTNFTPDINGRHMVAKSVDSEKFYTNFFGYTK